MFCSRFLDWLAAHGTECCSVVDHGNIIEQRNAPGRDCTPLAQPSCVVCKIKKFMHPQRHSRHSPQRQCRALG